MLNWRFEAQDWNDPSTRVDIRAASQRKTTLRLNSPSTVAFSINGDHPQALEVVEMVTDIIVSLGPVEIARVRIGAGTDSVGPTNYTVAFSGNDYRDVLARRKLRSTDELSYNTDERSIAMALISTVQGRSNGNYGIVLGSAPGGNGPTRQMNFKAAQWVGKEITSMLNLGSPGSHWDIGPGLTFDYWAGGRGESNGVWLEYRKSVSEFTRARTAQPFGNDLLLTGSSETTPVQEGAVDVATDPRGRWDAVVSYPDIKQQATLNERATWQADKMSKVPATYNLTLRPGFWEGPDHIGVGDIIGYKAKRGRINDSIDSMQVTEIGIDHDADGGEKVRLAVVVLP